MVSLDRLNKLNQHYGLLPLTAADFFGFGHKALNNLDTLAGFDTKGGTKLAPIGRVSPRNYVGARLALHEQHLARPWRFYHWLGEDSDLLPPLAGCACGYNHE